MAYEFPGKHQPHPMKLPMTALLIEFFNDFKECPREEPGIQEGKILLRKVGFLDSCKFIGHIVETDIA